MNKHIIKSLTNNDLNNLLNVTYSNIKQINKLFNDYISEYKNNTTMKSDIDKFDISQVYSVKLMHNLAQEYTNRKSIITEILLLRQIILNIAELFVENKVHVNNEFKDDDRKQTSYHLIVCDNEQKIKLFVLYLLVYRFESFIRMHKYKDKRRRTFVGIDYEFVRRKIALMQINFENIKTKDKMINYLFIVNPSELNSIQMKLLVRKLMENKYIFKIFHGADSLDLPYTFDEMFNDNKVTIKKFMTKFVDTRFLCEYLKGSIDDNKKCTIYEALNYFGTISDSKLDHLNKTHDAMGPVQNISWDIHKLSKFHRNYAFYDVIYLPRLFSDIYKMAYNKTPDLYKFYRYLNEITRFVLSEKRQVTSIISDIKLEVDELNNNILKSGNNNFTLITIFNEISTSIKIDSIKFNSVLLLNINYFKSTITLLLKKIIYHILTNNYKIYINKTTKQKKKIHLNDFNEKLIKHNYVEIHNIVQLLYPEIKLKVNDYLH